MALRVQGGKPTSAGSYYYNSNQALSAWYFAMGMNPSQISNYNAAMNQAMASYAAAAKLASDAASYIASINSNARSAAAAAASFLAILLGNVTSAQAPTNCTDLSEGNTACWGRWIWNNAPNGLGGHFSAQADPAWLALTELVVMETSQVFSAMQQALAATQAAAPPPTCPAGTYWNGNACIKQVVFQQPPTSQPAAPIHVDHAIQGYAAAIFGRGTR